MLAGTHIQDGDVDESPTKGDAAPLTDWAMMRLVDEGSTTTEACDESIDNFQDIYSVRDLLGVGAYGVVLLVKNRILEEKSALKIINKSQLSYRASQIVKNESAIMKSLKHSSVVDFKRIYENDRFIMIEMEYVSGGQLKRLYEQHDEPPLSDTQASQLMKSLLEGVQYIHSKQIIHRDLKPENILLTSADSACTSVKIVDFGLSAVYHLDSGKNDHCKAGTLVYMAPEQAIKHVYSKKVDLWACGVVMYKLLCQG